MDLDEIEQLLTIAEKARVYGTKYQPLVNLMLLSLDEEMREVTQMLEKEQKEYEKGMREQMVGLAEATTEESLPQPTRKPVSQSVANVPVTQPVERKL